MYHGPGPYGFAGAAASPRTPYPPAQTQFSPYPPPQPPPQTSPAYQGAPKHEACYNCGNGSHWAQNCPEPRRAVPAGSLKKQSGRLHRGAAPPALSQPVLTNRAPNPAQPYAYNSPGYGSPQSYGPPTPVTGYAPPPHGMPSPSAYSFSPATPGSSFSPHQTQYPWSAPATPYAAQHGTPPLGHGPFGPHSQTSSPVTPSTPYGHHPFGGGQPHQPPPSQSPAPEAQKKPVMLNNAGAVWVPAQPTSRPLEPTFKQSEARGPYMPPRLHTPGSTKRASISVYIDHATLEKVTVHVSKTSEWVRAKEDPVFCLDLTEKRVSLDEMKRAIQRRAQGGTSLSRSSASPTPAEPVKVLSHGRPVDALRISTSSEPITHALPPRPQTDIGSAKSSFNVNEVGWIVPEAKDKAEDSQSYGWLKRNQKASSTADAGDKTSPTSPKNIRKISLSEYSKSRKSSSASKSNENEDEENALARARHSAKSSTETLSSLAGSSAVDADTPPTSALSTSTDLSVLSEPFSKPQPAPGDQKEEANEDKETKTASFELTAMNASRKRARDGRESRDANDLGHSSAEDRPALKRVCS